MRMRKKKHAKERLENCLGYLIENPKSNIGKWKEVFGNDNPIFLEIGCGKGGFITKMALKYPENNYIAIESNEAVMVLASEKAKRMEIKNLKMIFCFAEQIGEIFNKNELDGIFLNFSDPWPKVKHEKRRLTHKNFLELYKNVLKDDAKIQFKTDNVGLFDFSKESFVENGFEISNVTYDLHSSDFKDNVMTEYEELFSNDGKKICRLEAVKNL